MEISKFVGTHGMERDMIIAVVVARLKVIHFSVMGFGWSMKSGWLKN